MVGTCIGFCAALSSAELGPSYMAYFGALGVANGNVLGRKMGNFVGGYIFDNLYIPYIYDMYLFNKRLESAIDYNKQFIPDNWSFPY